MNHCLTCEYYDECEHAEYVNFCEDCKDCAECLIRTVCCKAGQDIECNNGFEPKGDYCSKDDED